jgi:hypothetical protein
MPEEIVSFFDLPALIEFQIPNGLKTGRNLSLYHAWSNITQLTKLKIKYERSLSVTHHRIFT